VGANVINPLLAHNVCSAVCIEVKWQSHSVIVDNRLRPRCAFFVIVDDDKVKLASTLEMDVLRHGTNVDMVIARRHKGNCVNT